MDDRSKEDRKLDETLEESFPASDAPANTVETAVRVRPTQAAAAVTDNTQVGRLELAVGDETAFLAYERGPGSLVVLHTEVPVSLRGQGFGSTLVKAATDLARAEGVRIVAVCPFAREYLRKRGPA